MFIYLLNWERIAIFLNCLCTLKELQPAPAALPFGEGCLWDLPQQWVVILAFLAQVFIEKLWCQNFSEIFRLHRVDIVDKAQHQKVVCCIFVNNVFFIFFLTVCVIGFTTPSGYHFHDFLPCHLKSKFYQFLEDKHTNYIWWKL